MKNLQEIRFQYFAICKVIISQISDLETPEQLIENKEKISQLYENVSFLKVLENSTEFLEFINCKSSDYSDEIETHDIPEFSESLELETEPEIQEEILVEDTEELPFQTIENEEINSEINQENEDLPETPEKEEIVLSENTEIEDVTEMKEEAAEHYSGKVKLAHIKGLKIQSLFDEEVLKEIEIETETTSEKKHTLPEFKLDFNDRFAFSKMLFGGSQTELNEVVRKLNSFENIDDAKDYLSDMYYDKKWEKVDDYAQRLWTLVESRFL